MRRVLIGTPAYDFRVDVRYAHSLLMTLRLCIDRGVDLRWLFQPGDAIIQNARNELVRDALAFGFDDLIFIDSDQDWEPEWVLRLLSHPVDCVGAAVRKKTDEREMYNVKAKGGVASLVRDQGTGLITAPDMALGTGFIRFSRKALQALWDDAPKYKFSSNQPTQTAWIFDIRPVNGELVSEDTYVSDKLRALGIQTWLDPTMNGGHIGLKRYAGDFTAWLAKERMP